MATQSSILDWEIPWTEEPGLLQSLGSQSWTRLSDFTLPSPYCNPKEVRLETAEIKGGIVDSTNEYILASKAKVKLKTNSAC